MGRLDEKKREGGKGGGASFVNFGRLKKYIKNQKGAEVATFTTVPPSSSSSTEGE